MRDNVSVDVGPWFLLGAEWVKWSKKVPERFIDERGNID